MAVQEAVVVLDVREHAMAVAKVAEAVVEDALADVLDAKDAQEAAQAVVTVVVVLDTALPSAAVVAQEAVRVAEAVTVVQVATLDVVALAYRLVQPLVIPPVRPNAGALVQQQQQA